jgi:hypothetical protein
MPNIKFNYLYRDAGNYKTHGYVVFTNPEGVSLQQMEERIRAKLIDGIWFYAHKWPVPDLHSQKWDDELDHTFHEFEGLEYTNQAPTIEGCSPVFQA